MSDISIIIPTLNEASVISNTLIQLQKFRALGVEIIVADGGSRDDTPSLASGHVDKLLQASKGRAIQMNAGAKVAQGSLLVFLHADTLIDNKGFNKLLKLANGERPIWGRFNIALDGNNVAFRVIETMMNIRSCMTGVVTGDHAMFVSQDLFNKVGGFPAIELMEDIAISKKLKRFSNPVCLSESVITSTRRWQQHGILKTVLLMWWLRLLYFFNVAPRRLSDLYR